MALDNITPVDELLKEALHLQSFLEVTVSECPEEIIERGNELSVIIARSSKMRVDAEYHRDSAMKSEIMELLKDTIKMQLAPSTVNKMIDSACRDYNYLQSLTERINRTATHQLDWCRTLVSKAKTEMAYCGGVSNKMPEARPLDEYKPF